jgi:membrane associated rhomboid family serine protease
MLGAVLGALLPGLALDWQPGLAWQQPWRWWSNVFVHYSTPHLAGNLLATALVGGYGWAAQVGRRCTAAWLLSWPLMHLVLLTQAQLLHYGGLSGLMHAGVACVNVCLIVQGTRGPKVVGAIMQFMLAMKIWSETPLQGAIQHSPDWDIPIAPVAHLSGFVIGTLLALAVELLAMLALVRTRLGRVNR